MRKRVWLIVFLLVFIVGAQAEIWRNPNAQGDARVADLLSKMTLDEKISQCSSDIPAIERLGIPAYMWYTEALHGVLAWKCTSFPQNIAMGATWDPDLMFDVATAISNEARALKNSGQREVMMFSPTVNIARDPRWGRNEECYSEDPFLLSEMARMYVRGMQGNDKKYLKTVCTVKHFIANNVEQRREFIQSYINEKDLREYYMPAYKVCLADEEAAGVMTALNGLNGIPCSGHSWLIKDVLRGEWGFKGYVVADWHAVSGMYNNMKYVHSFPEASALAIKATCDQECFRPKASLMVKHLKTAIEKGLIKEEELDQSVARLLRIRFLTGDFDPIEQTPWHDITENVLECDAHKKLALKAARKSIVLLKNENILPLKQDVNSVAVIGPFANRCWLGIYSGYPQSKVTPLDGIKQITSAQINYAEGCGVTDAINRLKMDEAVEAARKSEVAIVFVGNDASTATENNDRESLGLPGGQQQLIEEVLKVNKNTIVVLIPSGPTTIGPSQDKARAIVCAWANGQEQGHAIADILWGKYNPGGKLNSTWFKNDDDMPDMYDYNIHHGRTYMYYKGQPLYPFGYGLSYTTFKISNLKFDRKILKSHERLKVSVQVSNTGDMDGDEVVQLYIHDVKSSEPVPAKALKGFKRIHVPAGQTREVTMEIPYEAFSHYSMANRGFKVEEGDFEIQVGNSSADIQVRKSLKVADGMIPPVDVEHKSAWFDANHPNRNKKWYDIYDDLSFLKTKTGYAAQNADTSTRFTVLFTDPGFYVPAWDAVVNCRLNSEEAVLKLQMLDNEIDTYKVKKGSGSTTKLAIKIPIPPEYGKNVNIVAKVLKGDMKIESILILPPGNKPSFVVHPDR